jgi:cell division protein FtsL
MGLLLIALIVVLVGSASVIVSIVHRRRHEAKRQEDLAQRAAKTAVGLAVERLRGDDDEWHQQAHSHS